MSCPVHAPEHVAFAIYSLPPVAQAWIATILQERNRFDQEVTDHILKLDKLKAEINELKAEEYRRRQARAMAIAAASTPDSDGTGIPLSSVKMSTRLANCLKNMGLTTFEQVRAKGVKEMLRCSNLGRGSIRELERHMSRFDMAFHTKCSKCGQPVPEVE